MGKEFCKFIEEFVGLVETWVEEKNWKKLPKGYVFKCQIRYVFSARLGKIRKKGRKEGL